MYRTSPLPGRGPSPTRRERRFGPAITRNAAIAAALGLLVSAPLRVYSQGAAAPPNILVIAVDDLNHWVRHLGRNPQVKTPNLDRLAARGITFTHAYCVAPACNPSRAALMSGLRPSTTGVYGNSDDWRPVIDPRLTLPMYLATRGYSTGGAGKIYHGGFDRPSDFENYARRERRLSMTAERDGVGSIQWGKIEGGNETGYDKPTVDWIIGQLRAPHARPFFLACGIIRPHLPWEVPKMYFDRYPVDEILLPPVKFDDLVDLPAAGREMAASADHEAMVASGKWKEAVRAYLAAISYADYEIGRVLDALDASPYWKDTIVVLFGDHGWHLGEKHHWRKFSLWEEGTRVPLIWMAPGVTHSGTQCERTVDLMCVYPTLCELAGVPIPGHVEGLSIRKLLADPKAPWDYPAVTTYGWNNHAVRTEAWRYIRYHDGGEELYADNIDPFEWTNLATQPESVSVKQELARWLPRENHPALNPGGSLQTTTNKPAKPSTTRSESSPRSVRPKSE